MNPAWRDDDTWWKQDWQCSDWQAHTEDSNKDWQPDESPAEQPEQRAEAPRQRWENQATRLKWQAPPIAPQSSAGSTSTVPIARQDKRAADVMESGEPTKRLSPSRRKPSFANGENGSFCNNCATTAEGSTGGRCCRPPGRPRRPRTLRESTL